MRLKGTHFSCLFLYQSIWDVSKHISTFLKILVISPLTKIRPPPWPLYPKILFHQSIDNLLKRRHTKFQEHSQYSFFMNFYSFIVRNWSLDLRIFSKKINIFFWTYDTSNICRISSGSRICNPFISTTHSSRVIAEKP